MGDLFFLRALHTFVRENFKEARKRNVAYESLVGLSLTSAMGSLYMVLGQFS